MNPIKLPPDCVMAFDVLFQAVNIAQERGAYKLAEARTIVDAIEVINRYLPKEETEENNATKEETGSDLEQ